LGDLNKEPYNSRLPYGGQQGFTTYPDCTNSPEPYTNTITGVTYPNYCFGDLIAFGLWDDLYLTPTTQQGIYYQIDGTAPSRRTSFEFYLGRSGDPTLFYHFLMNFYENRPNVVNYQYINVTDSGIDATVGVQRFSGTLVEILS
jgi:hypothetical protein